MSSVPQVIRRQYADAQWRSCVKNTLRQDFELRPPTYCEKAHVHQWPLCQFLKFFDRSVGHAELSRIASSAAVSTTFMQLLWQLGYNN